jgi:hypothetical protein
MAALDYGMALSRGLIAPQKELQAEIKKLAGTAFKSDDWWNKQLDRQIKQGISETKTKEQYLKYNVGPMQSGTSWADVGGGGFNVMNPTPNAVSTGIFGYNAGPTKRTVEYQEQKDLTAGQLKAIQTQAEQSADKVKREARLAKSKTKRGARGSGGLLGKSTQQDKGLSAKLPELGSMGLGIEKTYLG